MSLVVCSNQDSDATTTATFQNIYKPFSFRNALSSTYVIPKNAQVALQSCKYNLDGSVPLSGADEVLYQYFGVTIDDEIGQTIFNNSTSFPIRTTIYEGRKDSIVEVSAEELATKLQDAMNDNIFHPNLRNLIAVSVVRNATSNEFEGYSIEYDQYDDATLTLPANTEIIDQLSEGISDTGQYQNFSFESGEFTSNLSTRVAPAVGVVAARPLSAYNGELVVTFTNPNSNGVDWGVGLSRFVNDFIRDPTIGEDVREPSYFHEGRVGPADNFFFDYLVCRKEGELRVFHTCHNSGILGVKKGIEPVELIYGDKDVEAGYDIDTNANNYERVKYVLTYQQITIIMIRSDGTEDILYEYDASLDNESNLSVVHQSRWNLYPLLYLATDEIDSTGPLSLFMDESGYTQCLNCDTLMSQILLDEEEKVSWYNSVELEGALSLANLLESSGPWNDVGDLENVWAFYYTWGGILSGANPTLSGVNKLITVRSKVYKPSYGANTSKLLGFTASPIENFTEGTPPSLKRTFTSDSVPRLLASRSMFVRLENMSQQSVNARVGNRSSIIAHLPRFDGQVETGRIYHEPKNLIFLDLNNSQPMPVSSFDISFVYSNEQYVTALTGQSVVCLYFREKPSERIQQV